MNFALIADRRLIGVMNVTLDETIKYAREAAEKYRGNTSAEPQNSFEAEAKKVAEQEAEKNKQLADWLEELKELREYKARMEMQYLDDIGNPLEPLKLQSALESEIFKYTYRKEHKPQSINILDYTIMAALKHCLYELTKR